MYKIHINAPTTPFYISFPISLLSMDVLFRYSTNTQPPLPSSFPVLCFCSFFVSFGLPTPHHDMFTRPRDFSSDSDITDREFHTYSYRFQILQEKSDDVVYDSVSLFYFIIRTTFFPSFDWLWLVIRDVKFLLAIFSLCSLSNSFSYFFPSVFPRL